MRVVYESVLTQIRRHRHNSLSRADHRQIEYIELSEWEWQELARDLDCPLYITPKLVLGIEIKVVK